MISPKENSLNKTRTQFRFVVKAEILISYEPGQIKEHCMERRSTISARLYFMKPNCYSLKLNCCIFHESCNDKFDTFGFYIQNAVRADHMW